MFSAVDREFAHGLALAEWRTYSGLGASLNSSGLLSGTVAQVRLLQTPAHVLKSCAGSWHTGGQEETPSAPYLLLAAAISAGRVTSLKAESQDPGTILPSQASCLTADFTSSP